MRLDHSADAPEPGVQVGYQSERAIHIFARLHVDLHPRSDGFGATNELLDIGPAFSYRKVEAELRELDGHCGLQAQHGDLVERAQISIAGSFGFFERLHALTQMVE